jgi:hypothetical protein
MSAEVLFCKSHTWIKKEDCPECKKTVLINRGTLFFRTGETIYLSKLKEYFTDKAIDSLESYGYIKIETK